MERPNESIVECLYRIGARPVDANEDAEDGAPITRRFVVDAHSCDRWPQSFCSWLITLRGDGKHTNAIDDEAERLLSKVIDHGHDLSPTAIEHARDYFTVYETVILMSAAESTVVSRGFVRYPIAHDDVPLFLFGYVSFPWYKPLLVASTDEAPSFEIAVSEDDDAFFEAVLED